MSKHEIANRNGEKLAVLVEQAKNPKGLVFVMHGLSGNKYQPHIEIFAEAFKEREFTVVRFDTTNTFGESEGQYENATATNYFEDLEDVIRWASVKPWYLEPFCLAGHSLGGLCILLYAQRYPEKVAAIAPISAVISGHLSAELLGEERMKEWETTGWREEVSSSTGRIKRLKWQHMTDRMTHDAMHDVRKLTMPSLLVVGSEDETTPQEHQQILYQALPGKKELHVIEGAPHTFREPAHLAEIKDIFLGWLDTL